MKKLIKKTPIPIAGLMLGLAGLGNLIASYGIYYRYLTGILSVVTALLLAARFLMDKDNFKADFKNPVIASVTPTFFMALMILATYFVKLIPELAAYLWYSAIILHTAWAIWFTIRFIFNYKLKEIFPSYFIVYVGLVVASVTAPVFNNLPLGRAIFYFGFIAYLLLLPVVIYRIFWIKKVEDPALPTITIFTAPAGLCLAGYLSTFPEKNIILISFLTLITLIMLIGVTLYLPKMLRVGFYPSFSAFTFPYVISAIGLKMSVKFWTTNSDLFWLKYPAKLTELLAIVMVLFVFFKYGSFFYKN